MRRQKAAGGSWRSRSLF